MGRNHIKTLFLLLFFDWRGESKLCRNGWTNIGENKCIKKIDTKLSWTKANEHCIFEGAQLLRADYLNDITKEAHSGTIHIAGRIQSKIVKSSSLLPWKNSNQKFGASCLEWVSEMDLIRGIDCNNVQHSFTCITQDQCKEGWTDIHSQCFFFSENPASDFDEAKVKCAEMGSTLATIRSEYTNNIVKNSIRGISYIGLEATVPYVEFYWADGGILGIGDFSSWDKSYPKKNQSLLNVQIDLGGKWRNVDKFGKKFYVCSTTKTTCPFRFTLFENSCFYISRQKRAIGDAEKYCESHGSVGAFLATIPNEKVNDFISKQLKGEFAFFGLIQHEDRFVWSDGSNLMENDFVNWSPGMPEQSVGACTGFDQNKTWISRKCDIPERFVCEMSPYDLPTYNCNFDDNLNWLENPENGRCYLIINRKKTFDESQTICKQFSDTFNEANLLSIHSPHEQHFIVDTLSQLGHRGSYWIGFNSELDFYRWTDESPFSYSYFANNDQNKSCSKIPLKELHSKWIDADCIHEKLPSICAKKGKHYKGPPPIPDANDCPKNWLRSGHQCLFFSSIKENYTDAIASCKSKKSTLAYIQDERTNYFIQGQINNGEDENYYFGLNDIGSHHQYVWPDGSRLSGYDNWGPYEPSDYHHVKNCIEISCDGHWKDNYCAARRKYICAKQYNVCPSHWHSRNKYCIYTSDNKLVYEEAQKECVNKNAHLASIHNVHENQFIASTLKESDQAYWLGLRKDTLESECSTWLDGSTVDYKNFLEMKTKFSNETALVKSSFYGVHLNQNGFWMFTNSSAEFQFACSAKQTHFMSCPHGWKKSSTSCYILVKKKKGFRGASLNCKERGGYLVRIDSAEEMDFILSDVYDETIALEMQHIWIGLKTKKKGSGYYVWEDGSDLTFSHWERRYPIQMKNMDCVSLNKKLKRFWINVKCASKFAYICETSQKVSRVPPPEEGGCTSEQIPYQGSCYEVFLTKSTFDESVHACAEKNGILLKIKNMEIQARLISIIHSTQGNFFLGLKYNKTTYTWTWLDNSPLNGFANWGEYEPKIDETDPDNICAVMTSQRLYTGVWKTVKCEQKNEFICQTSRNGHTDPPEITTPATTLDPNLKCPQEYVMIDSVCYYYSNKRKHVFDDAEKECSLMGGHLVLFKDHDHETHVLKKISYSNNDMAYIGLREFPQLGGFHWLDPSVSFGSYVNWAEGQPESYGGSKACVSIQNKKWTMKNCLTMLPFICAVPPKADPFPTLPPDPTIDPKLPCEGSDDSWFMLPNQIENYCYKLSDYQETWHSSLRQCREEGGELLSIHNVQQNNLLWRAIVHESKYEWFFWIGINDLNENEEFRWTDGTALNFVNWKKETSGGILNMESCGQMLIKDGGLWQKAYCGLKRRFACIRPQYGKFPSPSPPLIPKGHCKEGVPEYLGYCYFTSELKHNWTEAKKYCSKSNSNLVSIHSIKEMSFLISRVLPTLNTSLSWIGYQDLIYEGNFGWSDESSVDYTNWAGKEPVSGFSIKNNCVGAYTRDPHKIGKWANIHCKDLLNFICKHRAQTSETEMTYKLPKCKENEEFDEYNGNCYLHIKEQKSWLDAKKYCRSKNSNLVSVQTMQENSFLTAYSENDTWIGLYISKDNKEVQWTDGKEYIYENFELDEMVNPYFLNCVSINSETGKWNLNIDCDRKVMKTFWCSIKKQKETTTDLIGKCPETRGWVKGPIKHCYYFGKKVGLFYEHAEKLCTNVGGTLAGIHTRADNDWLRQNANPKHHGHWIGIQRVTLETGVVEQDNFYWADLEPFKGGFHSWAQGYRNKKGTHGEFIPMTGKWSLEESKNVRDYFICSAQMRFALNPPQISTLAPPYQSDSGLSAAQIVGSIIGSLFAITAVFAILYLKKNNLINSLPTNISFPAIPNPFKKRTTGSPASFLNENYETSSIFFEEEYGKSLEWSSTLEGRQNLCPPIIRE